MDFDKLFEGKEISDDIKSSLTNEIKKEITDLEGKVTFQETEAKKAFEKRDAIKAQVADLESKIANGNTESRELLEAKTKEIEALTKDLEDANSGKTALQTELDGFVNKQKEVLLGGLAEGSKELEFAKNLKGLDELTAYVNTLDGFAPRGDKTKTRKHTDPDFISEEEYNRLSKNFQNMTIEEREKIQNKANKSIKNW